MKYTLLSIAAFFLCNLAPASTLAQSQRALEVSIFGIGPAVDSEAVKAVRAVIGKAITEGVVDNYITYSYGIEGGTASCIQLSPFQNSEKLLKLKRKLLQIRPNPSTTSYDVRVVAACTQGLRSPVTNS
jgi:hypothetical protein